MPSQSVQSRVERLAKACQNCRDRKVRCTGVEPCKDCLRLHKECVYPPLQPRKRKARGNRESHLPPRPPPGRGSDPVEGVIDTYNHQIPEGEERAESQSSTLLPYHDTPTLSTQSNFRPESLDEQPISAPQHERDELQHHALLDDHLMRQQDAGASIPNVSPAGPCRQTTEIGSTFPADPTGNLTIKENRNSPNEDYNWEPEPWSWTSICSEAASEWIWNATGSRTFGAVARHTARELISGLPYDKSLKLSSNAIEIDEATAWKYVESFYQDCWESALGIIDRGAFEAQLRAHFSDKGSRNDPAWFIIRNVIYASGYRALLAKDPAVSIVIAQAKAGSYFKNALSALMRVLVPPSSLMAVQAVTLMACYVEALGSPAFTHFLCSNALHHALCMGLHRQPDKAQIRSDDEISSRSCLWWAIYNLEKYLALLNGRPSAIDDDHVSTQLPTTVPIGSNVDLTSLNIAHRHAQIQAQISRQLLSFKTHSMSVEDRIDSIAYFQDQLQQLLQELPLELKVGALARPRNSTRRLIHSLYIHFSVYGSLMAINTYFFYPWLSAKLSGGTYNDKIEKQIASSSHTIAEAARKLILALQLIDLSVMTPSWLALHFPICAAVNLFIYILQNPTLSTTSADLSLLDVCVGHFGYIEYLTASRVSSSLLREMTEIASKVVKTANAKEFESRLKVTTAGSENPGTDRPHQSLEMESLGFDNLEHGLTALNNLGMMMEVNGWNTASSFDLRSSEHNLEPFM